MKYPHLAWLLLLSFLGFASCVHAQEASPRQRFPVDKDWRFFLGDATGAQESAFNDSSWRTVSVPHDWSIEGDFDAKAPMGGAGGFRTAGTGWYRRSFEAPAAWRGKQVRIEFEGVYMNAEVWINGSKVADQPYGYTSFFANLTPYLKPGEKNLLAVRVDNSKQKNSRWYSGSGIYRHVWVTVIDPVSVSPWGVFVRTLTADSGQAQIQIDTEVANHSSASSQVTLRTRLLSPDGRKAGEITETKTLEAGTTATFSGQIPVRAPRLWSHETPALYSAVSEVLINGRSVDRTQTPFGIRTLTWSVDNGLQLNGKTIKLYGGCVHHDNGALGAAAFDRAEERKVELLLSMGFNAVRTSHNPPSPAFLDACDRLGLFVMDEAFDCWNKGKNSQDYHVYFKDWWQRDLEAMVKRDRNHPSVIMWSIGNEIPERFDDLGADTAKSLADCIRNLDSTRPVTEGILFRPKPEQMAVFDRHCAALDIAGYNYAIQAHAEDHARVPTRVMVSTESNPRDAFNSWARINDNSYVVGDFMWSAIDYLGEAGIGRAVLDGNANDHGRDDLFPWHSAYCGDMDLIGTRKAISHYRNIVWDRGEKLYVAVKQPVPAGSKLNTGGWAVYPESASWTWPGFEGQPVKVEVYSRGETVKLYQDGKLIGEKPTGRGQQFHAAFDITYRPGTLKAEAYADGKKIDEFELATVGAPAGLKLTADRPAMAAGGQDLIFVTVEVVDKTGQWRPDADNEISFSVQGPTVIAGVGSGDTKSLERYQADHRKAFQGRTQVVLRSTDQSGPVVLTARATGLREASIRLQTLPATAASR
ncbi:MAG TPA: glycoside hydrolase family 2 TIM barrel-domain containing protein [Rariglobus sp.]|jgi:beta-galactosidase|nr:glycoside hydrolase family 2 TIM barrel-domain containing protein [Rariglobus sp.]